MTDWSSSLALLAASSVRRTFYTTDKESQRAAKTRSTTREGERESKIGPHSVSQTTSQFSTQTAHLDTSKSDPIKYQLTISFCLKPK